MQEEQKQAILLLRSKGEYYAEIANYLEMSLNTVKSFCSRNKTEALTSTSTSKETIKGVCKNCGATLTKTASGRKKLFCSDKCRYAWWNNNRNKRLYRLVCQYCGKKFISFGNKNRKFCSRVCYLLSRHAKESP